MSYDLHDDRTNLRIGGAGGQYQLRRIREQQVAAWLVIRHGPFGGQQSNGTRCMAKRLGDLHRCQQTYMRFD